MTTSSKSTTYQILILPRWYPNKNDVQLGIFIQRQIALLAKDFKFQVIFVDQRSDLTTKIELHSEQTHENVWEHIGYYRPAKGLFRKITNFIRFRKVQKALLKRVTSPVHLTHVHVPYRTALPALQLRRKKNTPFLITEHWSGHLNQEFERKNQIDKWLYRKIVRKATAISVVSKALQKAFKKNTGADSTVIPNYIEFDSEEKKPTSDDNRIRILSVGDLNDATKNFSGLIHSFAEIVKKHPNLSLSIIGGGPDANKFHDLAKSLSLGTDQLEFLGRMAHDQVLREIPNYDFYICHSNFETFGMTIAEALFCGLPVISTRCGGPEEFVSEENGFLISTAKQNKINAELIQAVDRMIAQIHSFDREKIQHEIQKKFAPAEIRAQWNAFYSDALNSK